MDLARRIQRCMSTTLDVMVYTADPSLADWAVKRAEYLETIWSRFIPTSDISRLNSADGDPVTVEPETITLIQTMQDGCRLSGGLFDPTTLPALVKAGFVASIDDSGNVMVLSADAAPAGSALLSIGIDTDTNQVSIPPGMTLDPGGIGKGLAADMITSELIEMGATGAMVSLGGDLAVAGDTADRLGWPVRIENPFDSSSPLLQMTLKTGGLATSTTMKRTVLVDGVTAHHTIDPSTEDPADTDIASATVIASSGWQSEILATVVLIKGSARGIAYLESVGAHGVVLTRDQQVLATNGLESQWMGSDESETSNEKEMAGQR